jgi:hypothetical protein
MSKSTESAADAGPGAEGAAHAAFEERSRLLFRESVAGLDMRMRSRLNQARHAALDAAAASTRRPRFNLRLWTPAAGVTAAAVLGAAMWFGLPGGHGTVSADSQPGFEDLDLVTASDGGSDPIEMLQNDLDFYDFADKAAAPEPAA